MRITPLITAALVALVLFGLVMKRDAVFAIVGRPPADQPLQDQARDESTKVIAINAVEVVAIRSGLKSVDTGIVLSGLTQAARLVELQAETSGLVVTEPLRKGTQVEKGQVLCELDGGTRYIELEEARARLEEAQANQQTAATLASEGYGSETSRKAAEAALRAATASLERAEAEITRLRIRAPFSGLLESDTSEIGSLLQRGTLCATIIQIDPIKLVGFVAETDVDKIMPGTTAVARLVTGREIIGKVTFISRTGDPDTKTFRLEITASNEDLSIRDGATVEIFIATGARNAHLIPKSALTLNDDGRLGVQTVNEDKASFIPVDVIQDTAEGVWITGPPDNTGVIVVGHEYVIDGSEIQVTYQAG